MQDMEIELQEILAKSIQEVQEEIDKEVMRIMLISAGRHEVKVYMSEKDNLDAVIWCEENVGVGKWTNLHPFFLFENEKDAIMFKLKWA
ncbi:MAG TPA: hypothetical protein VFM18_18290 [Methanosarcina sp.]|nr:hypothetical protein [Methanosarcina sp.]